IGKLRYWKYNKGEAYYNCEIDKQLISRSVPPPFRAAMLEKLPSSWHQEVLDAPFSYLEYAKMYARIKLTDPRHGLYKWQRFLEDYRTNRTAEGDGLPDEQLPKLSDLELRRYIERMIEVEDVYNEDLWLGFFIYYRDAMSLLGLLINKWYDGDNPSAFADLVTGATKVTATVQENRDLWELSE